ncbi:DNA ligase (ATP) [Phytophthora boehmeriae]|uniref:DNA ligase n=1 Tax=Phytophthora boehmeriae TaxID=109152 RepID=A0A8T1WJY4_9STRA|nr:DNA ligase (ATP) [Phytophthora boehmeriae]
MPTEDASDERAALRLSFGALCRMLEAVERTPKSDAKLKLLFSDALRAQLGGGDLYPLMRLVLPQLDQDRTYNLKEKKIAKIYIDVLGMAAASKDAQKLEHFNDPKVVPSKSVGDFAAVLYEVLLYRSLAGDHAKERTLQDINGLLDALVQADSNAARKKVIMKLATEFPASEQKWIVRIVLKDLKVGLRHEHVLKFLHPDAMEMYNHTNDLHKICTDLRNSAVRYVPQLEPFQVFSPMLAKRVAFGECITEINADAFLMEPKLDGERITCHVQGKEVQYISRNGVNYTELYGPAMTPHVISQLVSGVDCILDGEMLVWDNTEYRLREFGLLKNVANAMRNGEATTRWLCYIVWDVVYLGGSPKAESLIHEVFRGPGEVSAVMGLPLHARRKLLLRILSPLDHRITIIEQTVVNAKSPKERHDIVMAEVDRQVANGGEGVIMKDLNAHYMCGESSRRAKKWLKLKPDYAGMTTDLDVLIIGGLYGTGRRRSGNVSTFLLGVLAQSLDENTAAEALKPGASCPIVYTFAKVGTGYNLDELEHMRQELEPYWQPWDDNNIPPHLNGWKPQKNDLKPDLWIDPRHSKILEVYGFELTYTTLYQTGLTIRFPRCKSIRSDKEWYQCMNLQDLNAARGSLSNKRANEVALGQKSAAKRAPKRQVVRARQASGVLSNYSQAALEGVEQERDVFEGMEFCVLPGKYGVPPPNAVSAIPSAILGDNVKNMSKQIVEKLLHSFGGTIVQNPIAESTSYVVAAGDAGFKVVNLKKQGLFNIVHLRWVLACVAESRLLPLKASVFIFATESKREFLAKEYDRYGDHFTEHTTPGDLRRIVHDFFDDSPAATGGVSEPWQTQIKALPSEEAEAMDCEFTFLSHCVVYFLHREEGDDEYYSIGQMKLLEQQVRLYGGVISPDIDAAVTHIVISSASDRVQVETKLQPIIRKLRRKGLQEPSTVTKEWVEQSVEQRTQLSVQEFFVAV